MTPTTLERPHAVDDPPDLDGEGAEEEQGGPPELEIEAGGQMSLAVGGRKPDSSMMKLRGGAIKVAGQFEKGSHLRVIVGLRVGEVHLIDKIDAATGDVVETIRKHVARVESVEQIGS